MPQCSRWLRFKQNGKQFEGYCPDAATWLDNTNLQKKGGRPLCNDHYQEWLRKVNKRYRYFKIRGVKIS